MKIHLIAIGGSIMHNLAIALHKKGYHVSGSDDQVYEPARGRLDKYGLLPTEGWDEKSITTDIDLVILGMHAKPDNPELAKARALDLHIMSFPEFIYHQSKEKLRVVVAGSHGKTTVTSMIMHALKKCGKDFDYAVGSTIAGFEDSVKLTENAPAIIIEGDEYLTSPIDRRPKFMWYQPDIALINGIAWDHINVFPTYEGYVEQFRNFIKQMAPGKKLLYFEGDTEVKNLAEADGRHLDLKPYALPDSKTQGDQVLINIRGQSYPISVFGIHNLQNLAGAQQVCEALGIAKADFWQAIGDYTGAGKRLEKVPNKRGHIIFRDFAHSPSKVKASVEAVKSHYPDKNLVAVLELHTFSSLNKDFIKEYRNTLQAADISAVYIDNHALKMKGGEPYKAADIHNAFNRKDITFIDDANTLKKFVTNSLNSENSVLVMSSGNLGGLDLTTITA